MLTEVHLPAVRYSDKFSFPLPHISYCKIMFGFVQTQIFKKVNMLKEFCLWNCPWWSI